MSPFTTPYERFKWLSDSYRLGLIDALECELHLADMEQVTDDWKSGITGIRIPPDLFPELKDQFMNTYAGLDNLKLAINKFRTFLEQNNFEFEKEALQYANEARKYFQDALECAHTLLATLHAA